MTPHQQGLTPNTCYVLITVHDSPTTDNSALIRSRLTLYAKLVIGESSRKRMNFQTLTTSMRNGVDVVIPLESIQAISYFSSSLALRMDWRQCWRMIKFHGVPMTAFSKDGLSIITTKLVNEELKEPIMVAMPKLVGEGSICALYVLSMSGNLSCVRIVRYSSWSKAKVPRQEATNSNPFDALNSIENDDNLGTNGGNSSSAGKRVASSDISINPIVERIDKLREWQGKHCFKLPATQPRIPRKDKKDKKKQKQSKTDKKREKSRQE
ncbi:hypothetical protein Tco_1112704 [Tanacetum coccineum]|uniref:Uncharacterized protein n=1 Tax=Tanacetum coccineum TaxID=301880 RepID=A0ABQ5IQ27_9ASTR